MADEGLDETLNETHKNKKNKLVPILVISLLMIGEGVGIFFLIKSVNPDPAKTIAHNGDLGLGAFQGDSMAEVELVECRPSNRMAGKLVTFHIRVSGLVTSEDHERATELVEAKKARLEDGVNIVIRSAEPKHLNEPGLETIKRRLKYEIGRIFGDDELIKDVLLPQILQSGGGV